MSITSWLIIVAVPFCIYSQSLPKTTPKSTRNAADVKHYAEELKKKPGATLLPAKEALAKSEKIYLDFLTLENKSLDKQFDFASILPPGGPNLPDPWRMVAEGFVEKISGGAPWKGIQLVTVPTDAAWNDAKYGNYRAWRLLGNSLPAWGPIYRTTQETLDVGYRIFLDNLDIQPPNQQLQAKADKARIKYDNAVQAQSEEQLKSIDRWVEFDAKQSALPPGNRMSYEDWFSKFEAPKLSALQAQTDLYAQAWTALLNQAGGGYAFAANLLIDYNNISYQGQAASSADPSGAAPGSKKAFYRTYSIDPDLSQFIETSKAIPANAPPKWAFTMNKSSGEQKMESTSWGASASYGIGFFSFGASAGGSSYSFDSSSDQFRIAFSARNIGVFTITPGQWFNGTAVQALQNGPFLKTGPVATGQTQLWGQNGVLRLMSAQIIVAYRPKVSATMSQQDYSVVKSSFSAGGGISIGPFGFGGSYNRSSSDVKFDDASRSFTAEDTTDVPQIVAIVCSVLPNFE